MTDKRSEKRKQWKREISAGGIVYKKDGVKTFVLLIMPAPRTDSVKSSNFTPVWTFPKGWIGDHGNESVKETAIREVKEEGGVKAKIIESLGEVKYFFTWQGENVFKIVSYYLMEYVDGDPADHDWEVAEAKWFELDEAEKVITYKTDKEVFKRALKFLGVSS